MRVHRVEGDGNCLFRSVSHQVYGDDKHHGLARRSVADYMSLERPFFQSFVEGDGEAFDRYISEKRRDGSWGDEPEIQALCELYDRPCEVWAYDAGMDPRKGGGARILRTFHAAAKGGSVMRLSYYGGGHYDSLVNDSDEFDPLADPGSCELLALQKLERGRRIRTLLRLSPCQTRRPRASSRGTAECFSSGLRRRRTSRPPSKRR